MELEAKYSTKLSKTCLHLPCEIEILLLLPITSILKCTCICKEWHSLISSSQFINAHLKSSRKSKTYANHTLLLNSIREASQAYYTCTLSSVLSNTPSYFRLDFPLEYKYLRITGTCNGLLSGCFDGNRVFLYNPCTRKLKILPPSPTVYDELFIMPSITYGFCYDELNDDHKLVELQIFYRHHLNNIVRTYVRIYSLKTGHWRKNRGYYKGGIGGGRGLGLPIGGVLHWVVRRSYTTIFRVDTVTYTFGTMSGPTLDNPSGTIRWGILDFGGCLGVYQEYNRTRVDIWVMKGSWTKVLSLPYCSPPRYCWSVFQLQDGGEVFVSDNVMKDLKVYNSRENSFVDRELGSFHLPWNLSNPVFIESLLSPIL